MGRLQPGRLLDVKPFRAASCLYHQDPLDWRERNHDTRRVATGEDARVRRLDPFGHCWTPAIHTQCAPKAGAPEGYVIRLKSRAPMEAGARDLEVGQRLMKNQVLSAK
jgi:hypothetical protein